LKENNYEPLNGFIWASSDKHPDGILIHVDQAYSYLLNQSKVKCWSYHRGKKVLLKGDTITAQAVESITQSLTASGFSKKQAEETAQVIFGGGLELERASLHSDPLREVLLEDQVREVKIEGSFTKPESRLKAFGRGLYNFIRRKDV
tara:strand:+ start:254 stop:694 length:441 start_codon:yes stop_codon:yes gene_type:complete